MRDRRLETGMAPRVEMSSPGPVKRMSSGNSGRVRTRGFHMTLFNPPSFMAYFRPSIFKSRSDLDKLGLFILLKCDK